MQLIGKRFGNLFLVPLILLVITFMSAPDAQASGAGPAGPVLHVAHLDEDAEGFISLSIDDLSRIGTESFVTSTIWTEGEHEFTGVSLHALLNHLEVSGSEIRAYAINDYSVTIPTTDARPGGPIVAFQQDGAPIPRRLKGPFWIVYPFDSMPEYRTETIYSRSIWQLDRLVISK